MKRFQKISPFIAVSLVLLITTSITLYGLKTLKDRDAADQWVSLTNTVIATTDQVLLGMVNMETGFRGYLLTGQDSFLEPYHSGKVQFETAIAKLLDLTDDSSAQEERWKEIQTLEKEWQNIWVNQGIALRQDVNAGKAPTEAVLNYVISEGGKDKIDSIRVIIAEGKRLEETFLARRIQTWKEANNWAYVVMIAGIIFSVALGLGTGVFLTRSNLQIREHVELQQLLLEEREKERMEIARDLHDGPVQELLATSFTVQGMMMDGVSPQAAEDLKSVQASLQQTIGDLRAYAMELRSPVLVQFGLEKAIQSHLEDFRQKYPQLQVNFEAKQSGDLLSPECRNTLFRIFQEAMNNIARHSQASEVTIFFQKLDRQAVLELRDNGVGFEPPNDWLSLARQGHLGLVGIRERANAIGGQVEIQSRPGKGTRLKVVVPI